MPASIQKRAVAHLQAGLCVDQLTAEDPSDATEASRHTLSPVKALK